MLVVAADGSCEVCSIDGRGRSARVERSAQGAAGVCSRALDGTNRAAPLSASGYDRLGAALLRSVASASGAPPTDGRGFSTRVKRAARAPEGAAEARAAVMQGAAAAEASSAESVPLMVAAVPPWGGVDAGDAPALGGSAAEARAAAMQSAAAAEASPRGEPCCRGHHRSACRGDAGRYRRAADPADAHATGAEAGAVEGAGVACIVVGMLVLTLFSGGAAKGAFP